MTEDEMRIMEMLTSAVETATPVITSLQEEVADLRRHLDRMREERDQLSERMEIVLRAGPSTSLAASVFDRCKRLTAELDEARAELARLRARMPSDVVIDCIRGVVIYHNVSRGVTHEADVISAWIARQEDA